MKHKKFIENNKKILLIILGSLPQKRGRRSIKISEGRRDTVWRNYEILQKEKKHKVYCKRWKGKSEDRYQTTIWKIYQDVGKLE